MNSRTVDLIYLDPPFNSKKQYKAPIGTPAEGQQFDDTWKWTDLDDGWLSEIDSRNEALSAVIRAARLAQNEGTAAYLTMMGVRLLELHRVLKPTGNMWLHCDPTASHYLKAGVDAVFGKDNFKNEVVWCYKENENATKHFPKKHDTLLFYSKTKDATFNVLRGEPTEAQLKRYNHIADGERYAYMKRKMRKLGRWSKNPGLVDYSHSANCRAYWLGYTEAFGTVATDHKSIQ